MDPQNNNKIIQELKEELNTLKKIAVKEKMNIASLALNYCLKQEFIDNVLIGVDSVDQLEQNLAILNQEVSDESIAKIDKIQIQNHNLLNPSLWN